jgi:hypothetical protein
VISDEAIVDSYVFDAYNEGEHIGRLCECALASNKENNHAEALRCLEQALRKMDYAKRRIQGAVEALRKFQGGAS